MTSFWRPRLPLCLVALALLAAMPAAAATLAATPASFAAQRDAAQPDDTIALTGAFGALTIKGKHGLTLDATAATLAGLVAYDSDFTLIGGVISPPAGKVGVMARGGAATIERVTINGGLNSVVFLGVTKGRLAFSDLSGFTGDGVHVFGSQNVKILGNRIHDGVTDDLHHPDAIQFHNVEGLPQVSNVLVVGNSIRGRFQGIDNFDDPYNAWGGRMAGLQIVGNEIAVTYAHAIGLGACDGCAVVRNTVELLPGANFRSTSVSAPSGAIVEGNVFGPGVKLVQPTQ